MKVVFDIETNALHNPTDIWVIVAKDIDTDKYYIFRNVTSDEQARTAFKDFSATVDLFIGHNILAFDIPTIERLVDGWELGSISRYCDTLIISRLVDYSRQQGHSLESYGIEFGFQKSKNYYLDFFKHWSQPLEDYCVRDVDLTHKVYLRFNDIISDPVWAPSIKLEQQFQLILNSVHDHGFAFNSSHATSLLNKVKGELDDLDKEIEKSFPPKLKLIREIHPRLTQYGTLHRGDFRFVKSGDLSEYNGGPFCRCDWQPFNPASPKQVIEVLHRAGWSPVDKTDTHIKTIRELAKSKRSQHSERSGSPEKELEIVELSVKLEHFAKYGYKVNENNLATLPSSAPPPARLLSKRILRESRRRTLTEWLSLLSPDGRIHGEFQGIGAWTHRMAHQKPNLANIPNEYHENKTLKYLGKELRSLWTCTPGRVLWGVDAEGIQLRVFAHYINDKEFTDALVRGKKSDKTDPHSLNQRVLGTVCKSRQAAKRFIYALLLGAGLWKLAQVLECSETECQKALDRLLEYYTGFARLKQSIKKVDAPRGYFIGLDGREVRIPGDTPSERSHLCMSGYLQNGEAVIIKLAATRFSPQLRLLDSFLVDIVHDEYQGESPNKDVALEVCAIIADSIRWAGEELKLNCPMAGSFYDEDHKKYTIGENWYLTH